nr:hypothetical protein [Variovorax sp. PV24]
MASRGFSVVDSSSTRRTAVDKAWLKARAIKAESGRFIVSIAVHHHQPYDAHMPTKNPRLTITLEPLLSAQLRRISELTGDSQSKLISEILEGSAEVFARVITLLEAAKSATAEMRGKAMVELGAAQTQIEGQLGLVLDAFDQAGAPLLKDVEVVARRARRKEAQPVQEVRLRTPQPVAPTAPVVVRSRSTPISNRGVRSVDNSHREKTRGKK